MAARVTDKEKKKIIADYLRLESYTAVAKLNGRATDTVKQIVLGSDDFEEKSRKKKAQNTADILEYMEKQRDRVCEIIDIGLAALPDKVADAKSATEVTTALGTLIDKWTQVKAMQAKEQMVEDDPLTASIKALGEEMEAERERSNKNNRSAK